MSNYTLKAIDHKAFLAARTNSQESIMYKRRTADEMIIIADEFDGAYVTKSIIPKLQARFPKASRMYLDQSKYSSMITLTIGYGTTYDNRDEFTICDKEKRRINGEALRKATESKIDEADEEQAELDRLEETVKHYNAIADAYAEIENDLRRFFHDLPYADFHMEDKYKGTITPEKFAATVAE